jgi:SagB-type dehydrogenase family enzyme
VAGQQRHGGPGPAQRWAATGGNLASAEAYLLAGPSQFPDLPGSIFRYNDIGHGLIAIRRSPVPLARCLAGTGLTAPPVQLAIVLVGAVGRVRQKYDTFAYRLTHLDAGCAAAQLAAVGRGYGLTVSSAPGADDREDLGQLMPLEEALRRRRSVRTFGTEEVSRSDVDFIIRSGLAAERTQQAPGTHPDLDVTIATAAFNVGGLEPGLYLAAAAAGTVCGRGPGADWLAGLQAQYADAPALLLVCGNLARACAAVGPRGYPQLLVRAGAAGYGAWLAAVCVGLAGRAFGGSNHRVTAAMSRHGSEPLRHLFTVAIGHPGGRPPAEQDARDR